MTDKVKAKYIDDYEVIDSVYGNGSTTAFVLSQTPKNANSVKVYLNGLRQTSGFSVDVGTKTLTFTSAPEVVQEVQVDYKRAI